jgi:hypothetical protein
MRRNAPTDRFQVSAGNCGQNQAESVRQGLVFIFTPLPSRPCNMRTTDPRIIRGGNRSQEDLDAFLPRRMFFGFVQQTFD